VTSTHRSLIVNICRLIFMPALLITTLGATVAPTLSAGGMRGIPIMIAPEVLFHTLASDFFAQPDGTIYVQTGDIPAMWLRDASAQTLPYLRLAPVRPMLQTWIRGVIAREMRNVEIDPYANAFRADYRVWERKWEIDSLAYPVILTWAYEDTVTDPHVYTESFHRALRRIVTTYECEQKHDRCSSYRPPAGSGSRNRGAAPAVGLIWSAFRASDDPTIYAYNIPEQMFAVAALRDLADLAVRGYGDRVLADRASAMASELSRAIARYGIVYNFACGGMVYAYEVDGYGRSVVFDDANLPSLLGMPLSGSASVDDPVYRRTRACMLSPRNRYFFGGRIASGIGSPHTPRGYVWPLAMIARALTSVDRNEVIRQLQALADSVSSDGLVHESFDPNNPARFTRAEFGWANAMYAELLFRAAADVPAQQFVAPLPTIEGRALPASIAVVDPATALANRAALLDAFDRAVPFAKTGPDDM
jgi:meiotically up-regulated gene 157 (Mug157) protein